jgi:hypothetical protein
MAEAKVPTAADQGQVSGCGGSTENGPRWPAAVLATASRFRTCNPSGGGSLRRVRSSSKDWSARDHHLPVRTAARRGRCPMGRRALSQSPPPP